MRIRFSLFIVAVLCFNFIFGNSVNGYVKSKDFDLFAPYAAPTFTNGATQTLSICQNSSSVSLTNYLRVRDADVGNTLTFQISKVSLNGTLSGFPASIGSNGGIVSPTGITYTPTNGYSGTDVFTISVNDGTTTVQTTINVTINPLPPIGTISGITDVCVGASNTLTNSVSGGTWSSNKTSIATITSGGVYTGNASGTAIITYSTVDNNTGCTSTVGDTITVYAYPQFQNITGNTSVCVNNSITLAGTTPGGKWTSGNTSLATIDSSTGVLKGVSSGTVTITYTVTNNICSRSATRNIRVDALPTINPITYTTNLICVGSTTTFSSATTGANVTRTWSSSNTSIATVNTQGIITGVAPGLDTITLKVVNNNTQCVNYLSDSVYVYSIPNSGTITGNNTVCIGDKVTLSNNVIGGKWSSGNLLVATVDSITGEVTPVNSSVVTISYTVNNEACSNTSRFNLTVNPLPQVSSITGSNATCVNSTVQLSNSTTGGTWSSTNTSIATVDSKGLVTGLASGLDTIIYSVSNGSCTNYVSLPFTVSTGLTVSSISGGTSLCVNSALVLSNATSGGTWSSSNSNIATISASGVVQGISPGTATISYTINGTGGCSGVATLNITVNAIPNLGTISGSATVCTTDSSLYTNSYQGGFWISSDNTLATVSSSGYVKGISAGAITLTYTAISNGCQNSVTTDILVVASPTVAAISGLNSGCLGSTIQYTNTTNGGTWASSDGTVASITNGGLATGLNVGNTVISYSVTRFGCKTSSKLSLQINSQLAVDSISGNSVACVGTNTTYTCKTSGGVWASSNTAVANINATTGVLTPVTTGSVVLTYTVTNGNCTGSATFNLTVSPKPTVATIRTTGGGPGGLCVGSTIKYTNTTNGGVWSSGNTNVASINSTGTATGIGAGQTTIYYTVTSGGCSNAATTTLNVVQNAGNVQAINGNGPVCVGSTVALSDNTSGGTWTSGDATIATVNTTGLVTGIAPGTTTIVYSITQGFCSASATKSITVNALPSVSSITGTNTICVNNFALLSNATPNGTWTSISPSIASINSVGLISGVKSGTDTITYTVTNSTTGCTKAVSYGITVNDLPVLSSIGGNTSLCVGKTQTLTNTFSGGTWASSDPSIATINSTSGLFTAVAPGTVTVKYYGTTVNNCVDSVSKTITVNGNPVVASITAPTNQVCVGKTLLVSDATPNGTWSSSNTGIATVSASGLVTGISAGSVTISYTYTDINGCVSYATASGTVNATPVLGSIAGLSSVCQNNSITLTDTASGGVWTSSNKTVASVSSTGLVTGISGGTATITYSVTNSSGCSDSSTKTISVGVPTSSFINRTICSGSSYFFIDTSISTAGVFVRKTQNIAGCDSVVTLTLSVTPLDTSITTVKACSSYTWNGTTYSASGSYYQTFPGGSKNGCDSIAKLVLTISQPTSSISNVSVCANLLPYSWNGTNYTSTGTYTKILVNAAGCDSTATLVLTVKSNTTSSTSVKICTSQLPYSWNGTDYSATGSYTKTLTNAAGCDSIATLNLTVVTPSTFTTNATVCTNKLPYSWNGISYSASGTYTKTLINQFGCDSTDILILTVKATASSSSSVSVCSNKLPYTWNGTAYSVAGTYTKTLTASNGCDSLATLVLTVNPTATSSSLVTVCSNKLPYSWNGTSYTASGTYTKTFTATNGCDSIATLVLTVTNTTTSTTTVAVCSNKLPYLWNGTSYTASGTYTKIFTNAAGCDSIATLILTVNSSTNSTTSVAVCSNKLPYTWNGTSYSTAGTYTKTLTNSTGCDSVATLLLTINSTATSSTAVTVCSNKLPYSWNGTSYTSAGTYTKTLTASNGCDSVATLVLTVNSTATSSTPINICSTQLPYSWNGTSYSAAGTYTKTFTSSNGCDSIATLVLTVNSAVTPTISVAASATTITAGMSVTFTASSSNGGSSPTFVWYKNGIVISGANSSTYTTSSINDKDSFYAVLISGLSCITTNNVASNSIMITVNSVPVAYTISGNIKNASGTPINTASILVNGTKSTTTDASGNYAVSVSPAASYTIKVSKNNDVTKTNGVTVTDLIIVQGYILGKTTLNSPYKVVAADVNNDSKITTLDLLYMKRLVLGIDTSFPGQRLWGFVDSTYTIDVSSPTFSIKDSVTVNNISSDEAGKSFVGVKLGDVNWDWNSSISRTSGILQPVQLSYPTETLQNAPIRSIVKVPVYVSNFKQLLGMQFTLNYNTSNLQFKGIENNTLGLEYAPEKDGSGKVPFIWYDNQLNEHSFDNGSTIMELVFEKIGDGTIDINICNDIAKIEAFDANENTRNITMTANKSNVAETLIVEANLNIWPNPTSGNLNLTFSVSDNKKFDYTLSSLSGKTILKNSIQAVKGKNQTTLQLNKTLLQPGNYLLMIQGLADKKIVKMITIK